MPDVHARWVRCCRKSQAARADAAAWAKHREDEIDRQADRTLGDALKRYAAEVSPTHKGERWEQIAAGQRPSAEA